jgi:hypothetical protein
MSNKDKKVEEKKKPGRPAWVPNEETLKTVESLAAQGLTQEQIASCLGICVDTLIEKKKEYSEFSDSIKRGQSKGIAAISNSLFQSAKSGNTTAQLFYLKCRAGWKETNAMELTGKDGNPIEIDIDVTKLSEEQLRALAEGKSISRA